MADAPQAEGKKEKTSWFSWNPIKRLLRKSGAPVHYRKYGKQITTIPTYKELQKKIDFGIVRDLNKEMVRAENDWDGGASGTEEDNASYFKNKAIDLYKELSYYYDRKAAEDEYQAVDKGTGTKEEEITINVAGLSEPQKLKFHVPGQKEIRFSHGLTYSLSCVGYSNTALYDEFKQEIFKFLNELLVKYRNTPGITPKALQNISERIELMKNAYVNELINEVSTLLNDKETGFVKMHRSLVGGLKDKANNQIPPLLGQIKGKRLKSHQVRYVHTYRIITPYYVDSHGHIHKLEDVRTFSKEGKELELGLDENGWPLEVADEEYVYEGYGKIDAGTVLLDLFNGKSPSECRKVPYEMTEECDLLDMAVWVYVNYDAYRDDMRDGRYHSNSLSIMEHILREVKHEGLEYNPMDPNQLIGTTQHTTTVMRLNNPPGAPSHIPVTLQPSHLNPAMDFRTKRKDTHLGRKLYYDLQENLDPDDNKNITISTRGAALYIVHKVIEEVKFFDEAVELLQSIGENDIDGYDIGPNLGTKVSHTAEGLQISFTRWGHKLTRNPFKPLG